MVPQQQRRRRRRALVRTTEKRLVVARGPGGFGFTIAGQRPCVVSAVSSGGPAERAGLRAGDALLGVDGASVARAPHASVARLVAAAPGAIALSVAPREAPPTDTEDTEPDERAKTRRRHPPPRRRPHPPMLHHPGCHAAPSTSGVSEILQNLTRAQLTPTYIARLECRAIVGYLGTIDTPQASASAAPGNVRNAVRKLRQERRLATPVLLCVLPNALLLRRPNGQILAQYQRERIVYTGCGSEADRRFFGLVTSAEPSDNEAEASHSCHVFSVDPRMADHETHIPRAREFQISCTRDPVAERCLEFPPSAEYVVGVIRGMYSLPADESASPVLQQISKLAVQGDSPLAGNFARNNRAMLRPRDRRICRHEDARLDGQEFVANSPQPSNHSEITTTSSNSDSGIGFHNDGRNISDRILVVDFANQQPIANRYRPEMPRRPIGLVGCNFEDASFLSNTTPVVDGFGGQGRPLNLDDVILNSNDLQPVRHVSPRNEEDNYNYNNIYGNIPSSSRAFNNGVVYDQVYTENEAGDPHDFIPSNLDMDLELDVVVEAFNSVEIYEERSRQVPYYQSNESVENVTVVSGETSKASMDSVSVYSSRSHEEARPSRERHMQTSLDDMLVLGLRDPPPPRDKDDDNFVHPATVKFKVRKSKPLNLLSKTKHMLSGKERRRSRAHSASAGDAPPPAPALPAAASEPDLRTSEQSSPFRRWTTGNGTGSSYRHHDHRSLYNKQMSEGSASAVAGVAGAAGGTVSRWSLGLEQLLADAAGAAAFAHFLDKEYAVENIRFWWSCEQYSKTVEASERASLSKGIWERHLKEGASEPVNIDAAARRATELRMHLQPPPQDLFAQAQKQIFNVMKFDSYPRFLRSGVHAECARADLCGLPPPYSPGSSGEDHKLKKSVSNVGERRRSGSMLPWRLRTASRERAAPAPAPAPAPPAPAPLHIDVVKSADQVGAFSLCRVVLPDGATSVVEVDGSTSVRRLVDKLLLRRNLHCPHYDVLITDNEESGGLVPLESSSLAVRGLSVRVERRCVVRVAWRARAVSVRAPPARRLRAVLRAAAPRLHPHPHPHRGECDLTLATHDGTMLCLDTFVQEYDGERLRIVEVEEGAACAGRGEGGLRLCEDTQDVDAQSGVSVCSAGRGEGGAGGSASRVRAELRPGPPLHYHPPDFLDNLREKQKTRQASRASPLPTPRSPPPLPPKPAPRPPPTLV